MKILLKEFQEEAVERLTGHLRGAAKDSKKGERQAVCLTSTTGSGKTVMVARAIELLLEGDDEHPPISEATFLWITDQPELNEQTRKKMLSTSSVLSTEDLVVVDSSFDEETLRSGTVNFLNIQKLGKDKGLVTPGDDRTYSIWETIKNTIDARPGAFFIVVDEAHRGMTEEKAQAEAATIIQKFIKGSPGELPPVPIVLGISATPERFNKLILGTGRIYRPVDVDVADVRASGLIKETIVLHHTKRSQPSDVTMLREAARSLKKFTEHWAAYCASQQEQPVLPLLVVQVEDARRKGQLSNTDIAQGLKTLRDELGMLPNSAFAHSFQEGAKLTFGDEEIRYIAPSDIQDDQDVRVIFFKTSLNTGWDCPRAEVMMSFRAASDSTNIAQLVGRMVRTPLARRIVDDESLNAVSLYLPHYDSKGVERIVAKLSKPDDGMTPLEVEKSEDVVELHRAPGSEKAFAALERLPSYVVPRQRKTSQIRRLMKLARLLANDGLDDNALSAARQELLGVLNSEYSARKDTYAFKAIVVDRREVEIEALNLDVGTDAIREAGSVKVNIASENIEDLFEAAGRRLTEGLHKLWWRERAKDAPPAERERAKLEIFALCVNNELIRKLEKAAQVTVQKWLNTHKAAIGELEESSRAGYQEVRSLASSPELAPLVYPAAIQAMHADDNWGKHLYVSDADVFPAPLNKVEAGVIQEELNSASVVGWLRNTDRKPWALCVPYEMDGETRPMYPDFLVVRSEGKHLVVDLLEPHTISLADAPAKAAGLARFADQHADKFGRIEFIMVDGKTVKRVDLVDETVRKKVKAAKLPAQLRELFEST